MRKAEQTRWPLAPEYASTTDAGNQTGSAWYQGKSAPLADRLLRTTQPRRQVQNAAAPSRFRQGIRVPSRSVAAGRLGGSRPYLRPARWAPDGSLDVSSGWGCHVRR